MAVSWTRIFFAEAEILTDISKGLVINGAKVYVVALPAEPIKEKVLELNEIGRHTGGSAIGQAKNSGLRYFDSVADMCYVGSPATSAKKSL
jgi:hypothetical protein